MVPVRRICPKLAPRKPYTSCNTACAEFCQNNREIDKSRTIMLDIIRVTNASNASPSRSAIGGLTMLTESKHRILGSASYAGEDTAP